ncbi:unnamed protein product [Polarella glacialis]|uniref:CCT-beta n=1 Tax=Polarella glacialis TaxID=89957 RepID=A0A813HY25_POLGL|nr:unnamed protein product [Polarella glacialis]
MKSALARLTTTALVGLFSAFSADAVLFRGNAVQLKTDSDGSHWVNCAEQGQTCTCDSQVRWGTGDTWLVLEPSQSGEDILPGSVDKHCECKADWKHISPMMLSDSEAQKENAKLGAAQEQLKLEEDLVAERQQHGDITRIAMPDSKVLDRGPISPPVLLHADPLPNTRRGFNFNKFRAYLLARVKTGFVAPGVDQLFSSTEREITKDYPLPIMPVLHREHLPPPDSSLGPSASNHHFPGLAFLRPLPALQDMPKLRVMDVTEDEDVLIIGLWEEKATKQWCKFDIPDPDEFTWFSLWSPSERSHCSNCPDISGDSRFYPHSAAKAFWAAHHASFLEEGFILEKKISVGHKKVLENCNVLVANCQMDTDKIKIYGARVKVDSYEAIAEIEQAEKDKMKTKVDKICKHGCNVFINRQLIYNYPDQLFKDHGVMAIEHSDFEGSERLAAVLGSDIVSTFDNPELTKLGFCKRIEEIMIGEDKVIKFSGCAQGEACTIVLRGSSQHVLDEAERSLHDALAVLYQTVTETRVVWGGGSMEMAMADAVQKKMADIGGKEMAAMEQFGKALISIPAILADNGGLDSQELVGQLRAAHAKGKHTMGLEFNGGTVACMAGLGIMESFRSKLNQLCSAAEAAEMIIRVDDIIKNAPRQREG